MRTKKTVIAVLAAVIVISAALIVGCIEPQGGTTAKLEFEDNYQIPEGKGIVRFKITDDGLRTILPAITSASSQVYTITFEKGGTTLYHPSTDGTGTTSSGAKIAYGNINNSPLEVDVGTYTVTLTGWDPTTPTIPITGWTGSVSIDQAAKPVTAYLKGIVDGQNTGKFAYDITLPAGVSSTFTATKYGTSTTIPIALTAGIQNAPSPVTLDSGYYTVKLLVSETFYQTRSYVYILHIYPEMTSTMTALSVPSLIKNTFDVTFSLNGETWDSTGSPSYTGNTTQHILYGLYATSPGTPKATSGASFIKWNTLAAGNGNDWLDADFATNRILADVSLSAQWLAAGTKGDINTTIYFNVNDLASGQVSATASATISRNFASNGTVTFTLAAPAAPLGGGTWSDILWHVGGSEYEYQNPGPTFVNASGELIINQSGEFNGILAGTGNIDYEVTVTALLSGNTLNANGPYSATATIHVTP